MDGASLQAKIYAGYAKTALKSGRAYAQYRSASAITPIAPGNLLGNVNCLFAPNPNFVLPHKYKIPARALYADGRLLAQRDILVGPYGTFYVGDMEPLLPMQMIRCNDSLSIQRLTYTGTTQILTSLATAMPAFRQLKLVSQKSVTGIGGAQTASTAISEFFFFLPIAASLVREGDVIAGNDGVVFTLDTVDDTEIGTVLTAHQAQSV